MRAACRARSSARGEPTKCLRPARFVQIVIQVGSGRDDAVDGAFTDQAGDGEPQSAGGQGARHAEEDHYVVAEHALPDPVRNGKVASLERDPLHAAEQLVGRRARHDLERLDRHVQKA